MNGLYIGSMGMMNYMQHVNVHANNIANAQTTGFKLDKMTSTPFDTHEVYRQEDGRRKAIGTLDYTVIPSGTHVNLTPGSFQITGSATDFYLDDGTSGQTSFFIVEQDGMVCLTRDGHFGVNEEGYLKTSSGAYVLDRNNERIQIPQNAKLSVEQDGTINELVKQVNPQTGLEEEVAVEIARLQTRAVNDENMGGLVKHASRHFLIDGMDIADLPEGNSIARNYMLENSNVEMSKEMVDVMTNQKMIQASQRIMTSFDKVYEKEANEILK